VQELGAANKPRSKSNAGHFTPSMQTEAQCFVNVLLLLRNRLKKAVEKA
jgi:hypothetical protein